MSSREPSHPRRGLREVLRGVGGITENQARKIRFETTATSNSLIVSRCTACGHTVLSDLAFGDNTASHNRAKAAHREDHYNGRADNASLLDPATVTPARRQPQI